MKDHTRSAIDHTKTKDGLQGDIIVGLTDIEAVEVVYTWHATPESSLMYTQFEFIPGPMPAEKTDTFPGQPFYKV